MQTNLLDLSAFDWLPRQYPLLVYSVKHKHERGLAGTGKGKKNKKDAIGDEKGEGDTTKKGLGSEGMRGISLFSLWNPGEVSAVVEIVERLRKANVAASDIGVVSPYRLQAQQIKSALGSEAGIEVDVTERFQGQERQVIIVSTVRSSGDSGVAKAKTKKAKKGASADFLGNPNRFNVAATRAKSLLIIVGDVDVLREKSQSWAPLVSQAEMNGRN